MQSTGEFEDPDNGNGEDRDWNGDERRAVRRRYTLDRRAKEARKKLWFNILVPAIVGIGLTGALSWGVYVTHTTYTISAVYEQTFAKHLKEQKEKDTAVSKGIKQVADEYRRDIKELGDSHNEEMSTLRKEVGEGFREIRKIQGDIYNILVHRKKDVDGNDQESN